jgi:dTMP kinase
MTRMVDRKKGVFIAFEGIDGCGKSTQIRNFVEYLFNLDKHNHVILTRNPYKNVNIRKILREDTDPMSKSELLADLYIEDRRLQVDEVVNPNLKQGHFVVTDRYKLSTITYQNAQGIDMNDLIKKHQGMPVPDITFVIDVPASESSIRMKKDILRNPAKEHKFEANLDFLEKVRKNYFKARDLLVDEKIFIIDGTRDIVTIFDEIKEIFDKELINKKKIRYSSMSEVPNYIKKKLERYFSNIGGNIFVIQNFPSELTGGALARYSRSPTGLQLTIINEFLDSNGEPSQEKGTELMDRVLNAYGDESVGELESVHVGIENVSMIAIKTIEDRRIGGSPLEQSTRYVKYDTKDEFGKWRYYRPKEILDAGLGLDYEKVNNLAFEVYSVLIDNLQDYFKNIFPENEYEIDVKRNNILTKAKKNELIDEKELKAFNTSYGFTIRCAALDVGRCILPSSTLSQLGILGNGRFFTKLLTTLKSSELIEEKEIAENLEKELNKAIPTFIKWNKDDNKLFRERNNIMREISNKLFPNMIPEANPVTLVSRGDFLDEQLTGALYPNSRISYEQILKEVKKLSYKDKLEILKYYIGNRETRRDRTPRGFESGYPITFDLVGNFAEYRDLQRHRMLTQQRQLLTTELGFIMPPEIKEIGMEKEVLEVVRMMEELNKKIKAQGLLVASQYATLFNHRLRFILGMNLREFQHLSELRTLPQGHHSYRAMTMEMAKELMKRDEWTELALKFIDYSDPGNKIARAKEQSRIAGENLAKNIDGSIDLL